MVRTSALSLWSSLSLAASAQAGSLFAVDIGGFDRLYQVPPSGGDSTPIEPVGGPQKTAISGLAYNGTTNTLFGVDAFSDRLCTLNMQTGAATFFPSSLNHSDTNALEYHSPSGLLYAIDSAENKLFTVDALTGAGSAGISITGGFTGIEGLAYNPATNVMYGLADGQDRVVTIDVNTGVASSLPQTIGTVGAWRGLTYDWEQNRLLGTVIINSTSRLYSIDASTGAGTFLDFVYDDPDPLFIHGIAFVPAPGAMMLLLGAALLPKRRRA